MENNLPPTNPPPSDQSPGPLPPTPPPTPRTQSPPPVLPPRVVIQPSKKGRGWQITAIVLIVVLALVVGGRLLNSVQGLFGVKAGLQRAHKPRLEEVVTAWAEKESTDNKIAVIPVEGVIFNQNVGAGGSLVNYIEEQFKSAARDKDVKAVVLKVNSPGGEVLASDDISAAIERFQQETKKPVVASMGSLAASGGYYVAAPCEWIVAHEMTITGSIGVIMYGFNYRGLLKKVGVRPQVFKSGRFKDMLSSTKDLDNPTPEEAAELKQEEKMVKDLIDQTFQRFKSVVQKGRQSANRKGKKLASDWEEYADGRVLSGTDAYKLGFVDELGNFETAVKRAKTLAAISDANLIQYQQIFDLSNLFRLLGKSEPPTLKVDLGLDELRLQQGLLYYLCPLVLH